MRLLIVNDEPPVRSLVARALGEAGATCTMTGSAEEAIAQLVGNAFNIASYDCLRAMYRDGVRWCAISKWLRCRNSVSSARVAPGNELNA